MENATEKIVYLLVFKWNNYVSYGVDSGMDILGVFDSKELAEAALSEQESKMESETEDAARYYGGWYGLHEAKLNQLPPEPICSGSGFYVE